VARSRSGATTAGRHVHAKSWTRQTAVILLDSRGIQRMDLDPRIYERYRALPWFKHCGEKFCSEIGLAVEQVGTPSAAISGIESDSWTDAGTHAQGELTGYLARTNYEVYGSNWNRLAKLSRARLQDEFMPRLVTALDAIGVTIATPRVLLDLNRIALHAAFANRFSGAPVFFEKLLLVYESGHLPCGWRGDLDSWPTGALLLY
jgi:hypothetical protein